jgi:tetratricopeptide (TPR) repeat protein
MPTWTEKVKAFQAELQEEPGNPNRAYNLAMAQLMTVESGEAGTADSAEGKEIVAGCERALKRVEETTGGRHGNARVLLGRICMITGRTDEAARRYAALLDDMDPREGGATWANAALNLMAIQMQKKSFAEAQALGARWCAARPDDAEAFNRLGLSWGVPGTERRDQAACEKALQAFERAAALGHPQAAAHAASVRQSLSGPAPAAGGDMASLAAKFQQEVAALMAGPLPQEEKMRRMQEMQKGFQAEVQKLSAAFKAPGR